MTRCKDILLVARHELSEGMRSRWALVVLVLYVSGAMVSMHGFITALQRMEEQISETLMVAPGASTGAVADALWKSKEFRRMVRHLVRDKDVAEGLLAVPPVALIYGWLAFAFTPILVMLTSSARIAMELGSGSARLVFMRTSRLNWCLGKFLGQSFLTIVALFMSAAGAWCIARIKMDGLDGMAAAVAMTAYAGKAWMFSIAAVGLALGVSQVTRSPHLATVLGVVVWIGMRVLSFVADHYRGDGWRELWQIVLLLTPHGHWSDLWRIDLAPLVSAGAFLAGLGFLYFMLGYAVLHRRDV